MRSIRFLTAAGALLLPVTVFGQAAIIGTFADQGCTGAFADAGEFYSIKVTNNAADQRDDMLFDLRAKGGLQSDSGTAYAGGSWLVGPNWRAPQTGGDVHYVVATYPPTGPGMPGRIAIDSAQISDFDGGLVSFQNVGNSIPTGGPNSLASIGVNIPGTSAQFSVQLTPTVTKSFPSGSTSNGINIAFAQLVDVNDTGSLTVGCSWGAKVADPLDTTDAPARRGVIMGYNVYRIPGTSGSVPTPTDFRNALTDADPASGWVGFMDVRTLHQSVADGAGAPPAGTPSPVEVSSGADIAGMQNPNGLPYDADEVLIFQDSANSSRARPGGAALQPNLANDYWYAIQPVMVGKVSDFTAAGWTANDFMSGDHACDLDGDGTDDSVDLDTTTCTLASVDFISPQNEFGLDGLGLTNGSNPLLSAPMFFDHTRALPATGGVSVVARNSGSDVSISITTGLESRSIAGYNVYRQVGEERVRVNEQPILAQGAESNVYSLVDTAATQSARGPRATSIQYMVETVYSDGTPSTFAGPFTVEQPGRRRR